MIKPYKSSCRLNTYTDKLQSGYLKYFLNIEKQYLSTNHSINMKKGYLNNNFENKRLRIQDDESDNES